MDWIKLAIDYWPLIAVAGGSSVTLYRQWRALKNEQSEKEAEASGTDWKKEAAETLLPAPGLPRATNNARLAIWSVAAYGKDDLRIGLHDLLSSDGGRVIPWEMENAEGVIGEYDSPGLFDQTIKTLIIAVAGTNDKSDAIADATTTSQMLSDWGDSTGFEIVGDAVGMRSTSGFLGYTGLVVSGVTQCLKDHDIDMSKVEQIFLTGHSLGGAAVANLLCVKGFEGAEAHTFGGARPLKRFSDGPERNLTRTVDLLDPVTFVPISCKHTKSQQIIVTPMGSRTKMPTRYKPLIAMILAGYWIVGLMGDVFNKLGLKNSLSIASGHSMESYHINRKPFR